NVIMFTRREIEAIENPNSYDSIVKIIKTESSTKNQVLHGDKDSIIGFINAKEFLSAYIDTDQKIKEDFKLENHINPVIHVIESV
ncbi:hypothetical protein LV454_29295, partial [Escherichia coli]|nr:hypothetical protein [Escherichia coli]